MAERAGDEVGLVDHAGADRAGIDLDQADDVRVLRLINSVICDSTWRLERR